MKRYAAALAGIVLAAVSAGLDAQGFGLSALYKVTVIVNVPNAAVFMDNQAVGGNVVAVRKGRHTLRVTAPGYDDFVQNLNVSSHLTVNAKLRPSGFPLTVNSNVKGAAVFIDGGQIAGNVANVPPGRHTIRVAAEGYNDFVTTIAVSGPAVVNAPLVRSPVFALTVNSNAAGAVVFVDGRPIAGNVAKVTIGNHLVRVTANGYRDFSTEVNVRGPSVVNAPLVAVGFPLTVTANIRGAVVFIDNAPKGPAPFTEMLPAGVYNVLVTAPGYGDYQTSVTLAGPMTVSARLNSAMATLHFLFSKSFREPEARDRDQVKFYVDGEPVSPASRQQGSVEIRIVPGRHRIDVSSGNFFVRSGDFNFAPGQDYTIELIMELRVVPGSR